MSGPVDRRLLRHAGTGRAGIAVLAVLGVAQATATVLVAVALSLIIAGPDLRGLITIGPTLDELTWIPGPGRAPGWAVGLLAGAYAARAGLSWLEQVVAQRTVARVTDELRHTMVRALAAHGPGWVASFGAGRITALLTSGIEALRPWFTGYLPALVLGAVLAPLAILAMAAVDLASALTALVTLPLIPLLGALIGWATQTRARQRWVADARLAGHFLDVVRGLATLRAYGRAERQIAVVAELTDQHRAATMRVLRTAFLSSTALDLVGTLSVGLIAVEAGLRLAAGRLTLGPALLVILLAPEVYRPLREMAARYHAAADATAVIGEVDDVLRDAAPPTGTDRRPDHPVGLAAAGLVARYPEAAHVALDLPGLAVRAGELVALTGRSGAGKTTALRVFAGLHSPVAGTVRVTEPLYLPQRPALPHARTVADVFDDGVPEAEIARALRLVGLGDEVTAVTPLGEHGTGVSAGQRHRVALAAVLHRAGRRPVTLLLDEPTAHLDADTERLVVAALRQVAGTGSAVLAVAHRPALLAAADRVVTLDATLPEGSSLDAPSIPETSPTRATASAPSTPDTTTPPALDTVAGHRSLRWRRPWVAVLPGVGSSTAGLVLTGAAAWLLTRAATQAPILTLSSAVVLVRASAITRPLLRYVERLVAHEVAFARLGRRRSRVYAALIPRVPGPVRHRRGDLLTRVVNDVDAEVDGLLRGRLPAWTAAGTLAVPALLGVLVGPPVALAIVGGLVVAGVLAPTVAARHAIRQDTATATARAALHDAMVETVDGIEELNGTRLLGVPDRRSRELAWQEAKAAWAAGGAAALAHLGWGFAVSATALAVPDAGLRREWSAVALLVVVALGEVLTGLPDAAVGRRRAAGAGRRLAELTEHAPAVTFPASGGEEVSNTPIDIPPGLRAPGAVSVRGLVAGWGRRPVLTGLDLDLPPGAKVAVRGRSGAGKSTLGAVLGRLLDTRAGTITIGGRDLRTVPEATLRGRIVLVGDDTGHIFASTVRENLRLGRPEADDLELRAALSRVRLHDWLAGLPQGLDTWLGTGGSTMSGGQARRLATARALLADPELLILDEPTEGLDEPTAHALMADLLDAAHGRTVLLLTHRAEGLDRVDRLLTLAGGRLRPAREAPLATIDQTGVPAVALPARTSSAASRNASSRA